MSSIEELHLAARAAWPGVDVDAPTFARAVTEYSAAEACAPDVEGSAELYIALACAAGDPAGLRGFEQKYLVPLQGTLGRLDADTAGLDEVVQRLRIRLFVPGEDGRPRVLRYAGQGRLGGLVRVAAARLALNLRRDEGRHGAEAGAGLADAVDDPELQHFKGMHLDAFKASFEAAVGELSRRERTLLRLHLLDQLSIDEIGDVYAVHRSTAARWLSRARESVTEGTRAGLERRFAAGSVELRPLLELLHSRLDLSLSRVLGRA